MRTTIAIGDRLLESAKREARRRGVTLGHLVEDALRRELGSSARPARAVKVPVFHGRGGVRPGIDVTSNRALLEALDEGVTMERVR